MTIALLTAGIAEGAAIFAMTALAVRAVSERNAATRCMLWYAALVALLVVPYLTVVSHAGAQILELARWSPGASKIAISLLPIGSLAHDAMHPPATANVWLAALWLVGVAIAATRLVVSYVRIARIRRDAGVIVIEGERVLVSTDIAIPIAAGLVDPAIIIPAAIAETLAPADLLRIIAHERAHIRRNDIVANLIQQAIAAVLFFNPFAYAIVRNIVAEREAACDDLAVQSTGESDAYAECLASLAQSLSQQKKRALLTPGALGTRNSVVARVERMLRSAGPAHTSVNYTALGGIIMLFAILTLAFQAFTPASAASLDGSAVVTSGNWQMVGSACAKPTVDASVITPVEPQFPPSAAHVTGYVNVAMTIAPDGSVVKAAIVHSSGNASADAAVLKAAQESSYAPAIKNCARVESTYIFNARFTPGN